MLLLMYFVSNSVSGATKNLKTLPDKALNYCTVKVNEKPFETADIQCRSRYIFVQLEKLFYY